MVNSAPGATPGEGRRVLALVAGAVVFYVCIVVVSLITDGGVPSLGEDSSTVSFSFVVAWVLGAGLSSGLGVELAKRIAVNFNRIGLILLMVAPILLFAIALLFTAGNFTDHAVLTAVCALLGTAIGLVITFRDLMKPKKAAP